MTKENLRQRILAMRRALRPDEVNVLSAQIMEQLFTLSAVQSAAALLSYVASKDNEVETKGIIQWFVSQAKPVFVPVTGPNRDMAWSRLTSLEDLEPNRFGLLEPRKGAQQIDAPPHNALCLVPGIVFSRVGHRIGYGGGYFDRFLSSNDVFSIGLAYDLQVVEEVPIEPWDACVDVVVTESRITACDSQTIQTTFED